MAFGRTSSRVPRVLGAGGLVASKGTPVGTPMPSAVAMNKVGVPATAPDRNIATQPAPAVTQGQADSRASAYTYITKVGGTHELYSGQRQWVRLTLCLETAGPVAVGMNSKLTPINSGNNILLETEKDRTFTIAKGTKVYITSTAVSRVKVSIEPVPWLEQITGILGSMFGRALSLTGIK
jgi:hypothetical protein